MSQIFRRSSNTLAKVSIFGGFLLVGACTWAVGNLYDSSYTTRVNENIEQPVPFSHEHHVKQLGLDCRYCHTSVETGPNAGMPSTETCMTCHSQLFTNQAILKPVRDSWASGTPIQWTRVYDLPDYVYFDHSIHVRKGVSCFACHGAVEQMPLLAKAHSMQMSFCLDCHRHPAQYLRPADQVTNPNYVPPNDQPAFGLMLVAKYHLPPPSKLTSCSTCHH
jgi:hypothetical protein